MRGLNSQNIKMFELWLDTNPHATRKQIIEGLRKGVIEENTVAMSTKRH